VDVGCQPDCLKDSPAISEYVAVGAQEHTASVAADPAATRSSLVRKLRDWQDRSSWQEFFDTYWKLIYAVAIKAGLSDTEARDVVQETVVAVAKQLREGGYDRTKSSFKNWLCLITRRRIIDHLRRRTDPNLRHTPVLGDTRRTDTLARIPDPASLEPDTVWEEEWRKNLLDAAMERVKQQVSPKQYQIFDLSVVRGLPMAEVTSLLKVNAAQIYLARHRVGVLVKKEVKRLEARAEKPVAPGP
jgi:RNA polymerase sigma factor (sigma-70 family)